MSKDNVIQHKSFEFALKTIQVCKDLKINGEFVLSNQLLKSSTSIGANVEEAQIAQSRKDFIHRISIAYKEARETNYWLRLLYASQQINSSIATDLLDDIQELEKILASIIISTKSHS